MTVLLDVELAFSEGVPELDGAVSGPGDDLSVISREADGEDVGGVADKPSSRDTSVEVPKSESLVPRLQQ